MNSYNRVILTGNVSHDLELKHLASGTAVVNLCLALNERHKNKQGEWFEETNFVDVVLWARQAEVAAEYLGKGSPVLIEGRLKQETWEKDGQKHSKLKVIGEKMLMLGERGGNRQSKRQENSYQQEERQNYQPQRNEDIPF